MFFWLSLTGFLFKSFNIMKFIIISECVWVIIYIYTLFLGILIDDITLFSTSFFILAFAGLEFSVGLLLVFLFRNFTKKISDIELTKNITNLNLKTSNKLYINKLI